MVKTLDIYIVKLWLPSFLGFLFIITGILLFGRTIRAIEVFGSNPIDWLILSEMIFSIMPYFLTLTIPFSFFFALLKVLSNLQQSSEMDALLAAGLSPLRVIRSMFFMALIFTAFLSWTTMEWMPKGEKAFVVLYQGIKATTAMPVLEPQQFSDSFNGLKIYHSGEDKEGLINNFMLEETRESIYLAEKAKIERHDQFMILTMYDGVHLEGKGTSLRATYFSTFTTSNHVGNVGVIKEKVLKGFRPSLMSFSELRKATQTKRFAAAQAELQRRWILSSTVLILLVFALPLSSGVKRSGKSHGWLWGIALLLSIYNIQIALYKQVLGGTIEWWGMWAGQFIFLSIGLLLLISFMKYGHIKLNIFNWGNKVRVRET